MAQESQKELEDAIAADFLDVTEAQQEILRKAAHRYAWLRKSGVPDEMLKIETMDGMDDYLDAKILKSYPIVPIPDRGDPNEA